MASELFKGLKEMRANLMKVQREAPKKLGRAIYEEALIEMKESMKRTPVEYGALRASHSVTKPQMWKNEVFVKIEVGGPAAPYAIYVHENLEADHKVGQAKFLESTLNESAPFMMQRIQARLEGLLLQP